ncbi:hypothetical protein BH23ACT8_BH23ACT8_24390 [soil metagenome]
MRIPTATLAVLLAVGLVLAPAAAAQEGARVERVSGDGRVATAIEVSRSTFERADTVVMAYAHEYPDALVGAPLAAALGAPLILNDRDRMFPGVSEELERLDPQRVVLLGGRRQMGPEVVDGIEALGIAVERVSGSTRFGTAAAVAERLAQERGTATARVFVTEGIDADRTRGWPDALAVAPYAAHVGMPTLLVDTDLIPDDTARALAALAPAEVVIIGGEGAVSAAVERDLAADGRTVTRIFGPTRYATGAAVYDEAVAEGMNPATTWLATGSNYPDALAAGATVAARGDAFLLVDPVDLDRSAPTRERLAASRPDLVRILGGTAAVSDQVVEQVRDVIGAQ